LAHYFDQGSVRLSELADVGLSLMCSAWRFYKEMWDNMPSTAAFFTHDIQAYALLGDSLAWALALAHPRAPGNLDWETLGNTIAFFRSLNLPATMIDFRDAVAK
jgi:hypothetical protein